MKTYDEQIEMVKSTIAEFPTQFGLRAFPGETFTINQSASYVSDYPRPNTIYLYTYHNGSAFCKGTPAELRAQITPIPIPKTKYAIQWYDPYDLTPTGKVRDL